MSLEMMDSLLQGGYGIHIGLERESEKLWRTMTAGGINGFATFLGYVPVNQPVHDVWISTLITVRNPTAVVMLKRLSVRDGTVRRQYLGREGLRL